MMAKPSAAPLGAEILGIGVPKGAAAPAEPVVYEQPAPPPNPSTVPATSYGQRSEPEVRIAMTVRLPPTTLERLREMSHRTKTERQQIVDDALLEFMAKHGF
jgi:hypothetical protein